MVDYLLVEKSGGKYSNNGLIALTFESD